MRRRAGAGLESSRLARLAGVLLAASSVSSFVVGDRTQAQARRKSSEKQKKNSNASDDPEEQRQQEEKKVDER